MRDLDHAHEFNFSVRGINFLKFLSQIERFSDDQAAATCKLPPCVELADVPAVLP